MLGGEYPGTLWPSVLRTVGTLGTPGYVALLAVDAPSTLEYCAFSEIDIRAYPRAPGTPILNGVHEGPQLPILITFRYLQVPVDIGRSEGSAYEGCSAMNFSDPFVNTYCVFWFQDAFP